MTDQELERTLEAARRAGPTWNAGRQQQLKWAVMARVDQTRRRGPVLILALAMGSLAAGIIGVVGWRSLSPHMTVSPQSMRAIGSAARSPTSTVSERQLPRLADGSSIVLDGPSAILKKTLETNDEVAFQLEAGGAHFEVAPRPSRLFRVHAGPVTVQVIGTRFHVQRQDARSRITVDRGKVLVSWWGGSRELMAGEEGMFPPENSPAAAPPTAHVSEAARRRETAFPAHASIAAPPAASHVESALRAPAATVAVASPERPAATVGPEAIFARADRARSEGKPELAVSHLREIVDRYPSDPHAALAAFTVGRLLLESLGRPRQAAAAFAQARTLANGGPLGEDALAREVEALHAAGDSSAARQRADLYRQIFPNGSRLKTVMRFGGLRADP